MAAQLHKAMINSALDGSLGGVLQFEAEALVQTEMTRDNLEGTRAFFEKASRIAPENEPDDANRSGSGARRAPALRPSDAAFGPRVCARWRCPVG